MKYANVTVNVITDKEKNSSQIQWIFSFKDEKPMSFYVNIPLKNEEKNKKRNEIKSEVSSFREARNITWMVLLLLRSDPDIFETTDI